VPNSKWLGLYRDYNFDVVIKYFPIDIAFIKKKLKISRNPHMRKVHGIVTRVNYFQKIKVLNELQHVLAF